MGRNVDLAYMLGLPLTDTCPRCGEVDETWFDDVDIQCGNPNHAPGVWRLHRGCAECELEWEYRFKVVITDVRIVRNE